MAMDPGTSVNVPENLVAEAPRRVGTTKQRLEALEEENSRLNFVVGTLEEKVETLEVEITDLHAQLDDSRLACQALAEAYGGSNLAEMRREMEAMSIQIGLLQRAVSNGPVGAPDTKARMRVPEPRTYGGQRDAKEVDNFLFDMEQYFLALNMTDEGRKVATATMYLTGDAKQWWRSIYVEIQARRVRMDTWDLLKAAIKQQFFPENVEYNARRALRELRHTGSLSDYVKAFSGIMLDITDMSEMDKLFIFLEGLKPWARTELQRQRVADVRTAMGAAERLLDYNPEPRGHKQVSAYSGSSRGGEAKTSRPGSSIGGGERYPRTEGSFAGSVNKSKPYGNKHGSSQKATSGGRCYLCDGPHKTQDCPKKQLLNALECLTGAGLAPKQTKPQTNVEEEQESEEEEEEEEDNLGAITQHCNAISSVAVETKPTRAKKGAQALCESQTEGNTQPKTHRKKGLMYVTVKINGKDIEAMIDTGATHNYLASTEVERLGLVLEKGVGGAKAVNSAAQPLVGVARSVKIKVGPLEKKTNLSIIALDDFKLILGMEFFKGTNIAVLPQVDSLIMLGSKPGVIPTTVKRSSDKEISALQVGKGRKQNEPFSLGALQFEELESTRPIPKPKNEPLGQFKDAMPKERPRKLPPKRAVAAAQSARSPLARKFSQQWQPKIDTAKSYLEGDQKRRKNQNRRFLEFCKGDMVLVKVPDPKISKSSRGRNPKLMKTYVGPLPIIKRVGKVAYKVELPSWWETNDVLHVSQIRLYHAGMEDNTRNKPGRPQPELKNQQKRRAEAIPNHRVTNIAAKTHKKYLVKWKSCSNEKTPGCECRRGRRQIRRGRMSRVNPQAPLTTATTQHRGQDRKCQPSSPRC